MCYGADGGTSQELNVEDVEYVTAYVRYIGQSNEGPDAMWTMPSAIDCEEWQLSVPGAATVPALAKHTSASVNSSVLYDLANTIDGGANATEQERQVALIGCAEGGGQLGVVADPGNEAYSTEEY